MKNDTFTTPEILDVTAVEIARINAAAETERALGKERELTVRERSDDLRARWTDAGFQFMVGIIVVVSLAAPMGASMVYSHRRWPSVEPTPACAESVKVYHANEVNTKCENGASVESKPTSTGDIEVRCVCGKRAAQ